MVATELLSAKVTPWSRGRPEPRHAVGPYVDEPSLRAVAAAVARALPGVRSSAQVERLVMPHVQRIGLGMDAVSMVVVETAAGGAVGIVAVFTQQSDEAVREGSTRAGLSPREREVAIRLARGAPNAEIAAALGISIATTRHHVERILTKLGLRSRHDVAHALRMAASRQQRERKRAR